MKSPIILVIFLLLCGPVSFAQSKDIEVLKRQLPRIKDSIHYTDAVNKLSTLYFQQNVDSMLVYTNKASRASLRFNYVKGEADAFNNLGILNDLRGNLQEALRYYSDAYNHYDEIDDLPNKVQTTMNIGIVYYEQEKAEKARAQFNRAFEISKDINSDSVLANLYANYVSGFMGSLSKDSVLLMLNRARELASKSNNQFVLLFVDQLTAENMILHRRTDPAVALLKLTLQKTLDQKLNYSSIDILADLGDVTEDSTQAVDYYLQALQISRDNGFRASVRYIYEKLYDFYRSKGDNDASFYYAEQLLYYYDGQKNIDNSSGIDYIDYALKDKELQVARIQSQKQYQLLVLAIIICLMALLIIIVLRYNWRQTQRTARSLRVQFKQSEATTEALDRMNKDYARLLKVVAHDLRNPLSSINMVSTMVDPKKMKPDEVQHLVNIIKTSSKNCFELIDQLLHTDFNEDQRLNRQEVEIDNLLLQSVRLLNFKAAEKNQQIVLHNDVHVMLYADSDKLLRVINNLITNAIKFSPEKSTIDIHTRREENKIIFTVTDRGVGIPQNLHNKVFDPFTTAKRKGTRGETPFGLGLYICKQIVEAHKGRIWFDSEPGKGTTFFVELPVLNKFYQTEDMAVAADEVKEN